jgi:hypothetical protein
MRTCISCGKSVYNEAPAQAAMPAPVKEKKSNAIGCLLSGGLLIGVLLIIGLFVIIMNGGRARATSGAEPISAFVMCKQFVTDRLKSPATAVFPTYGGDGTQTEQLSMLQFRAKAYVDSQNGFGANVRTRYSCTVTNTGGNNWNLDDLTTGT